MKPKKCLVVDSMHESLFSMLSEAGWEADYLPHITREEIREKLRGYEGLIIRSKTTVDADLLGADPTLRFVARAGAGVDNVDLGYCEQKNIHVLHAAEGNRDAVAEFTVGALLSLLRKIPSANAEVRELVWERERNRGEELMGKTVSIIGYGNMGQAFAQRLVGFSCKILAYDKYKIGFGSSFCEEVGMERVFEETDILSLHIPLTTETHSLVDLAYLSRFKKNLILINTARGEIVPIGDLVQALRQGKVRAAALDVLQNEKLHTMTSDQQQSFNYLKSQSNVILSPHIAGWTMESHVKINVALVGKIKLMGL